LVRSVSGDDLFISYSRRDGTTYATGLADELTQRGLRCRLDLWETEPGRELPAPLKRAIRRSNMCVVVATEHALRSRQVECEIREFLTTRRHVIPIRFPVVADDATWLSLIEGLPFADEDDMSSLESGNPSPAVVARIEKSFQFRRHNQRLRTVFWSTAAGIVLLLLTGTVWINAITGQAQAASEQRAKAEAARTTAETQTQDALGRRDAALASAQTAERDRRDAEAARATAILAAADARREADAQSQLADERRRHADANLIDIQAFAAADTDLDRGLLLSLEANSLYDSADTRGSLLRLLGLRPELAMYLEHKANPSVMAVSSSGLLAIASQDDVISLWDVASRTRLAMIPAVQSGRVRAVAFSPDSRFLAIAGKTLILWDVRAGMALSPSFEASESVANLAFSADGALLAAGAGDGALRIWNTATRKLAHPPLPGHRRCVGVDLVLSCGIRSVAFHPGRRMIASGGGDDLVILWDATTGAQLHTLRGHSPGSLWGGINGLTFTPGGATLASGGEDGRVMFWDATTGERAQEPPIVSGLGVQFLAYDATGKRLAIAGQDQTITVWDIQKRVTTKILRGHGTYVNAVAFVNGGSNDLLVSLGRDGRVLLWDLRTSSRLYADRVLSGHKGDVQHLSIGADGRMLVSSGEDRTVRVWDVRLKKELESIDVGRETLAIALDPTGHYLAVGTTEKDIALLDLTAGERILLSGHQRAVGALAFNRDGDGLVSGSADGTIIVWDIDTRKPVKEIRAGATVTHVAFGDERTVAAVFNGSLALWDLVTPAARPRVLPVSQVRTFTFSRNRETIAVGTRNGYVQLFRTGSGQPIGPPIGRGENIVSAVALSPDATMVAAGYLDARIELLAASGGRVIAGLESSLPGRVAINDLLFSRDGDYVIEASGPDIRVWSVTFDAWTKLACAVANRALSTEEWERYLPGVPHHDACTDTSTGSESAAR
jgi:WD40 repeat protein